MALHGPVAHQGAVVGGAVAADGDFALLAVVDEAPAVEQFAVAVEADAVAAGQFFDAVGLAVAGEGVGRGASTWALSHSLRPMSLESCERP